jgi:hypothetical protein
MQEIVFSILLIVGVLEYQETIDAVKTKLEPFNKDLEQKITELLGVKVEKPVNILGK